MEEQRHQESKQNEFSSVVEENIQENMKIPQQVSDIGDIYNSQSNDLSKDDTDTKLSNGMDQVTLEKRQDSIKSKTSSTASKDGSVASGQESAASGGSGSALGSPDNASLSRSSSTTSSTNSAHVAKVKVTTKSRDPSNPAKSPSPASSKSKMKNPFSIFKRKSSGKDKSSSRHELDQALAAVKIESLPQVFVTKYLGFKETKGLYGVRYTRDPLRELFESMEDTEKPDLPLTQLHISPRGILVTEHKQNKVKSIPLDTGLIPIEFISYGVQDIQFTRIFTFIVVREMSSRNRKLECHAYLCDSSIACRKLALSVAMAFELYAKTLKGKPHRFQVDLQTIEHDSEHGCEVTNGELACDDIDV